MSVLPNKANLDRRYWLFALLLILVIGTVQVTTALGETATWDEPVHIAAGFSYWVTGGYQMNPEHPALVKKLCALPLLLLYDLKLDVTGEDWKNERVLNIGNAFVYRNTVSPDRILFTARSVNIGLTLLFAAYFAWWTRRRFGRATGLFALVLFAFDPNIIAHGRYITTDLAAAFFLFTTSTLWLEYLLAPRWYWLVLTGFSLGLALSSKYSTLFVAPLLLLMFWWKRRSVREFGLCSLVLAILSGSVIVSVYWQEFLHPGKLMPLGPTITRLGPAGKTLSFLADRVHMPSFRFLVGIDRVSEHEQVGHPSYLLGNISNRGWWYYFPVTFAVKTPAALLAGFALALVLIWLSPHRALLGMLLLPAVVYFGIAMRAHINLGVRHILPVYAFLYVAIACLLVERRRWRVWALAIPVLVALESAAIYPDYLAFFNVFAGGPSAGPRYLLDSNLDWGQDFKKLGRYLHQHSIPSICMTPFANVDYPQYGITWTGMPDNATAATLDCVTVVSATVLYGQYVGRERFAWLRRLQPIAIVGHSLYVYDFRKKPS